ncbi:unnamed protein product [Mytilus coruscus]|uniref:IgGFc-binding protein N-terminal domain-containing protein n=1 Tax=Mytilus coruscus TaxID=42192 RepID=A0A6J8CKJ9_MYTCO|nr:unnamed protein product [Mytilus coruscus]
MDNYPGVLEVFITTDHKYAVTVNITTPILNPSYFKTLTVKNKHVSKISFNFNIRGVGTELSNKGIYIQSDYEIAIYAVNKASGSTDAFIVFPVDVLGNLYYLITWDQTAQFMIIATDDNTVVTITPGRRGASITFNSHVYKPGMSLVITLDRYQTFHAFGGEISDYSGTHIKSRKAIAVLSGNKCSQAGTGYCDHLASQMTPVETFGNMFVTINMPSCNRPVHFKLVASENNTQVNISGRSPINLPNPGDIYTFNTPSLTQIVVSTDKPTALAFFAEGGCDFRIGDPAMILLPPIQQFASDYTFATVAFPTKPFESFLTIVISEQKISGLFLDGHNISSENWRPVVGSKMLRITNIMVEDGSHTIYHINPTVIFLAVSTGVAENCTPSITVPGDIIDNDCDGLIDEELQDEIDNDGDGEIDEDLAKAFEELNATTTSTTFTSKTTSHSTTTALEPTTTPVHSTTTELPLTTTSRHSTTTPTITTTSNMKDIVGENLSTDMLIAGVLSALFALSCFSTGMYFLQRKLKGKNGQVEDVFQSISSNNIPPVRNTVQFKA